MKNRKQRRAEKTGGTAAVQAVSPQLQDMFLTAVKYHQAGNPAAAEQLYRQVLQREPGHADTLNMFGILAQQTGRLDLATDLLDRAIAENRRNPEFHTNRGNILQAQGKLDDAVAAYRMALQLKPNLVFAHLNLAIALRAQGALEAAKSSYEQALRFQPDHAEARCNLGVILREQGRLAEAIACYQTGLRHRPDHAELWCNLGIAHKDLGKFGLAADCFSLAISLKPNLLEAINGLGAASIDLDRHAGSLAWLGRALACRPDSAITYNNLGYALKEQNRRDEALVCLDRALALEPTLADAHFLRSGLLLQKGEAVQGWADYEWRWRLPHAAKVPMRSYPQPLWTGDAAQGRSILLWLEQGAGDSIQFIRYALELRRLGWHVIIEARHDLARLFQSMTGIDVILAGTTPPPFDCHCPLLSVPRGLSRLHPAIPAQSPYLRADPALADHWKTRLAVSDRPKIGIAWRGSAFHKRDRRRSAPAAVFAGLLDLPGFCVVNLQKDARSDEIAAFGGQEQFFEWSADLHDFADTAALVANLDLVISVDTSVCHLAGAIGAPVWTMLDFAPDWQYPPIGNDCAWYPTMRLFRQPSPGRWDLLADTVREQLKSLISP